MATKNDKRDDVVEQARRELCRNKGDLNRLSKLTGRKLSYRWLLAFASGETKDPGTRRFLILCTYIGIRVAVTLDGPHFNKFTPGA